VLRSSNNLGLLGDRNKNKNLYCHDMLTHQTFAPGSTRDGCRHRIKQDFSYPRHFADNHQTVQEYLAPVNNSMELKAKDSGFYKVCCFALYKVSVAIIFIFAVVYFGNIAHDYQIGQLRLGYHNSRNLQSTVSISIPPLIDSNLCDIEEARGGGVTHVTPFYWHIPKSGGTSIQDYALDCLKLTVASEVGVLDGHQNDKVNKFSVKDCTLRTLILMSAGIHSID